MNGLINYSNKTMHSIATLHNATIYFTPKFFVVHFSEGCKHDAGMLAGSNLAQDLNQYAYSTTGHLMSIYMVIQHICYRSASGVLPRMQAHHVGMSCVRISVEWLFVAIVNYFKFLDFKKKIENRSKQHW